MSQTKAQLLGPVLGTVEYAGDVNFDSGTLFVDSSENKVGIRTTTPGSTLEILEGNSASISWPILTLKQGGGAGTNAMIRLAGKETDTTGLLIRQNGSSNNVDFNSSIFNELDGDLLFGTNNLEKLRITSTGNVGIGTDNPDTVLHIKTGQNSIITLEDQDTTVEADSVVGALYFKNLDNDNGGINAYIGGYNESTNGAMYLSFGTGTSNSTTERVRITSGGLVGIGTDNPQGFLHLHASDANLIIQDSDSSGISATPKIQFRDSTGAPAHGEIGYIGTGDSNLSITNKESADILFLTSNEERVRITSTGNVGIGITNPGANLNIASPLPTIRFTDTDVANQLGYSELNVSSNAGMQFYADPGNNRSDSDFRFFIDGSQPSNEVVRIASTGNVGIGTDSPLTELDARGSTEAGITVGTTSQFYGRLYGSSTLTFVGAYNGADLSLSTNNATGYNSKIMIKNGGNVGIGTTDPSQPLVVENSGTNTLLLLKATGSSAARLIFKNTGMTSDGDTQIWSQNNDLVFNTSNSEQVRIDSNGKVGIGTNDPDGDDLLGTPALTVYGTTPIVNIAQSQDFDSDADIGKLVFAANDPRTTSSQNGREMAFMKARWVGSSTDTLDTSVSIYTAQAGSAASTYERIRITPDYGLTGNIVERFIPPGIYYYDANTPGLITNNSLFLSTNVAVMNETGDRTRFGGWPTAYAHKKFVKVRMIYHGTGNVNGTVWSVSANIYWASNLIGYTQSGTTINFDLPSISNGKVYIKDITSIWPAMSAGKIVNSDFIFTENIGGSTIGITGLQVVEATSPFG